MKFKNRYAINKFYQTKWNKIRMEVLRELEKRNKDYEFVCSEIKPSEEGGEIIEAN